ncbi:MAG: MarR family winged helix-turn-helix transcriptional regulator [Cetobacterium sp.]|uniref:MarR family winged helix-turn-helix transcriptional regulator n=1 Tax=uncultured Cetobacterium sp. TaxID=527638 RepID=UPI0025D57E23|nr:MarR family transcriptional regulator [uncultured Cetobacterium sp.]
MGYEICIVARKIHQKLSLKFRDYDITPEQWVVLKELSNEDKISQNEISLRVGKDKNNIKALIDKLEKKEYLIRQQDTNDKRAFLIILTDKAYLLIEELKDIDKAFNEEISQNLNQSDLEQLKLLLDKFKKNL